MLRSYYCLRKDFSKQRQVCSWISSLLLHYCRYLPENKLLCSLNSIYSLMHSPSKIQVYFSLGIIGFLLQN